MAFAFSNIILNRIPFTCSNGRLYLNGSGIAFASEAAGSVTGLTVESGDARYVNITGSETVLGNKTFTGKIVAQDGIDSSGNFLISKGNPRLQLRDTSAGGYSQGFDLHTSTGRFYIDDNTHNLVFFDFGSNGNLDTLKLTSNQFSVYSGPSGATPQLALLVDSGRNTRISGNLFVSGTIIDNYGNSSVDPKNYYLMSNGVASIDWAERSATSSDSSIALSWEERSLLDSSEAPALDWSGRRLSGNWQTNTAPSLSGHLVNKGYLDSITGSLGGGVGNDVVRTTGAQSITGNKTFIDKIAAQGGINSSGDLLLGGVIKNSIGVEFINPANQQILTFGSNSVDWGERYLYATGDYQSVAWQERFLANEVAVTLDWGNRVLSGNWQANTTPSLSGHLVNKGYLDSITGSLGGGSDVVRTTGTQLITGNKTFYGETTFNNNVGVYGQFTASDLLDAPSINSDLRILYNDISQETLNWKDGVVKNFDGAVSIDWRNSDLKSRFAASSGSVLNWEVSTLFDNSSNYSAEWNSRQLYTDAGFSDISIDWQQRQLSGNWQTNTSPTQSGHIANKSYVDSNSSYTLNFAHTQLGVIVDSTAYYFGGFHGEAVQTVSSDASVVYAPTSGVLRSVVGNSFVGGTLASSETTYLVVSVNGSNVATGTYRMTGKNNVIQSGLQSINYSINKYDAIQMSWSGNWATNPTNVRHNLNAYITLG